MRHLTAGRRGATTAAVPRDQLIAERREAREAACDRGRKASVRKRIEHEWDGSATGEASPGPIDGVELRIPGAMVEIAQPRLSRSRADRRNRHPSPFEHPGRRPTESTVLVVEHECGTALHTATLAVARETPRLALH